MNQQASKAVLKFKWSAILATLFGGLFTALGLAAILYMGTMSLIVLLPALLLLTAGGTTLRKGPTKLAATLSLVIAAFFFGLLLLAIAIYGSDSVVFVVIVFLIIITFLVWGIMLLRAVKRHTNSQSIDSDNIKNTEDVKKKPKIFKVLALCTVGLVAVLAVLSKIGSSVDEDFISSVSANSTNSTLSKNTNFTQDESDFLNEIVMEWSEWALAQDYDGNWETPSNIEISKKQIKQLSKLSKNGDVNSLRTIAILNCFMEYEIDSGCELSLKSAVKAGDKSAKVMELFDEEEIEQDISNHAEAGNIFAQITMMAIVEDTSQALPWIKMAIEQGHIRAIYNMWGIIEYEDGADVKTLKLLEGALHELVNNPPKSESLFELRLIEIAETACELSSDYGYLSGSESEARAEAICERITNYDFQKIN